MHIEITDTITIPAQTVQTPFGSTTVPAYPLAVKFSFDVPATNEAITEASPAAKIV